MDTAFSIEVTLDPRAPATPGDSSDVVQFVYLPFGEFQVELLQWTDDTGVLQPSAWTTVPPVPTEKAKWFNTFWMALFPGDGSLGAVTLLGTTTEYDDPCKAFKAFAPKTICVPCVEGQRKRPYILWLRTAWYNEHGRMRIRFTKISD